MSTQTQRQKLTLSHFSVVTWARRTSRPMAFNYCLYCCWNSVVSCARSSTGSVLVDAACLSSEALRSTVSRLSSLNGQGTNTRSGLRQMAGSAINGNCNCASEAAHENEPRLA